jgi:hypothetical protein
MVDAHCHGLIVVLTFGVALALCASWPTINHPFQAFNDSFVHFHQICKFQSRWVFQIFKINGASILSNFWS